MDVALACMPCEWFSDSHPPPAYMEVSQIVWRLKHHTVRDEVAIMQKNILSYLFISFVQIVFSTRTPRRVWLIVDFVLSQLVLHVQRGRGNLMENHASYASESPLTCSGHQSALHRAGRVVFLTYSLAVLLAWLMWNIVLSQMSSATCRAGGFVCVCSPLLNI